MEEVNTDNNIPKPNIHKTLLDDENINSLIKDSFIKYEKVKLTISKVYIFMPIILSLVIIGFIVLIFFKVHPFLLLLYLFTLTPLVLIVMFIILWRLNKDKERIKQNVIKLLTNHFIIATFFMPNHRFKRRMFRTNKDYFDFENGHYYLDTNAIWLDDENYINMFYFYNVPNPLLFNFKYWLSKFFENKEKKILTKDSENNELELSYSSESIKLFRKDKLLQELHKGNGLSIFEIMLIIAVIIIIILEIVNLTKGTPPQNLMVSK